MRIRNRAQLRRLDVARRHAAAVPDVVRDKRDAELVMAAFDRLGWRARQAIALSRFDADPVEASRLRKILDDECLAGNLRRRDDSLSGYFGPRAPAGI